MADWQFWVLVGLLILIAYQLEHSLENIITILDEIRDHLTGGDD